jgi:ribosomal protein L40E
VAFCINCGFENPTGAAFCVKCRTAMVPVPISAPSTDLDTETSTSVPTSLPDLSSHAGFVRKKFCGGCGKELVWSSIICPSCGSPTGRRKDKSIAVLLAVFLGFWTWVYTYDRDKVKFWVGLGLGVLGFFGIFIIIGCFVLFGVWLWSVIVTSTRPNEFYEYFPNR